MLYGLLVTLFVIVCFFLLLIVLMQKGKGGMGIGTMGGGAQMLFGSSGGQDLFQKITWLLGAIFIFGSLGLSLLKTTLTHNVRFYPTTQTPSPIEATDIAEVAPSAPTSAETKPTEPAHKNEQPS